MIIKIMTFFENGQNYLKSPLELIGICYHFQMVGGPSGSFQMNHLHIAPGDTDRN